MLYDPDISKETATRLLLEEQAEATTESEQAYLELKAALDAPAFDRDRYLKACMNDSFKRGYLCGLACALSVLNGCGLLKKIDTTEAQAS